MELVTHPEMAKLILSGAKTTNILHGAHKDKSQLNFQTENKQGEMIFFATAECATMIGIRINPDRFQVHYLLMGRWQLASTSSVKNLIKTEGLKNNRDFWHRFKSRFQGTLIGWDSITTLNQYV